MMQRNVGIEVLDIFILLPTLANLDFPLIILPKSPQQAPYHYNSIPREQSPRQISMRTEGTGHRPHALLVRGVILLQGAEGECSTDRTALFRIRHCRHRHHIFTLFRMRNGGVSSICVCQIVHFILCRRQHGHRLHQIWSLLIYPQIYLLRYPPFCHRCIVCGH